MKRFFGKQGPPPAVNTGELIIKMDDLSELPCRSAMVLFNGKRYQITGDHEGLRLIAADGRLVIRPIGGNMVSIDQQAGLVANMYKIVPEESEEPDEMGQGGQ